jgi:peptidylprolyl isomerase
VKKAKNGDTVKIRYTGKSEDGELLGSTTGRPPLEVKIGDGLFLPGFEEGIVGMEIGETRQLTVVAEDGFGKRLEDLVISTDPTEVPDRIIPKVGKELYVRDRAGRIVTVSRPNKDIVILDANHPLAGKTLLFRIQLVAIL